MQAVQPSTVRARLAPRLGARRVRWLGLAGLGLLSLAQSSDQLWAGTAPLFYASNAQGAQVHGALGLELGLSQRFLVGPLGGYGAEPPKLTQVSVVKGLQVPMDLSLVYGFDDRLGISQASLFVQGALYQALGQPALAIRVGRHRLWFPRAYGLDGYSAEGVISYALGPLNLFLTKGLTAGEALGRGQAESTEGLGFQLLIKEPFVRLETELRRHAAKLKTWQLGLVFGH